MREKRAALVRAISESRRFVRKTLTKEAAPTAIREQDGPGSGRPVSRAYRVRSARLRRPSLGDK